MTAVNPPPDFGLYFFGDYPGGTGAADAYDTMLTAARFADRHDFSSVWIPERHFHSFGGIFPNPSVLAAALARETRNVRINSGSVVLPLHDPIRVAEEWSVVDNLSGGRVGIGCASGWNSNDFVFYPDRYGRHRELMYEQVEEIRRLWAGASTTRTGGTGEPTTVSLHPRPVQRTVPMYTAVVGRRESFALAARHDLGIVTNLMTQDIDALADNIAYYRAARAEAGLDPAAGTVTVLVHTYLAADARRAREAAFGPLTGYMRASLSLFGQVTNSLGFNIDLAEADEDDLTYLFSRAYDRYCDSRALIGSPESCAETVARLRDAGVDEIAALVDFGMPADLLTAGLPHLDALRRRSLTATAYPVTPGQRRMWFLERLSPGDSQNEPKAIRLTGPIDHAALHRAVRRLGERHPGLRSVYREADGDAIRLVQPHQAIPVEVGDHTGQDEATVVADVIRQESHHRFDLAEGPLFRIRLLRLAPEHHVLVFSLHHITVDAASATILTRDLSELYRAELAGRTPRLPMLPRRPATPVAETDAGLAYWVERLGGEPPVLRLPADRPRPAVQTFAGRARFDRLDAEATAALVRLGTDNGATLFMTLLTGLAATIHRMSGQDDMIVGVPVSQRSPGQRDVVDFLVNTLPLRFDTSGDPTFGELLGRVRSVTLDGLDHATVPFETVVAAVSPPRDTSRTPVFQIMAEFKPGEAFTLDLPGVVATPLDAGRDVSVTDMSLHLLHRDGEVVVHLEYNTDLFDDATAARFSRLFLAVLATAGRRPAARLSELPYGDDTDRDLNQRWGTGPAANDTGTVVDAIEAHAADAPSAVAIVDEDGELDYAGLVAGAHRIAAALRAAGIGRDDVVATWLPRDRRAPVTWLGVMRSGAAYLPLDPALGTARVATVLADSRAAAVLTTRELSESLPSGHDVPVLVLDTSPGLAEDTPSPPVEDDAAYVVYTSGSSGRPKGVVIGHHGLTGLCGWFGRRFRFGRAGRAAAVCGQSFDASVVELWPTLYGGGSVAIAPEEVRRDPAALAAWCDRTGVRFTLLPTGLGEAVLELPADRRPSLSVLMIGGDVLRRRPAADVPFEVVNAYGPTEGTVLVTTHPVSADGPARIPIGSPIDGAVLRVCDAEGRPRPVGAVGELRIGGRPPAKGYLHDPGLTAERFVEDADGNRWYRTGDLVRWTNDGVLEFHGRIDDQVKIRGFRVEPGESAAALRGLDEVADTAVLAVADGTGERRLVAYVAPRPGVAVPGLEDRLVERLAGILPEYLIPTGWVCLDRLPYDANGKVDRARLPEWRPVVSEVSAPDSASGPRTAWAEALGIPVEKVDDSVSFFESGGHSITAMRLLNRLRAEFGIETSMMDFYREPTLRAVTTGPRPADLTEGPASYQQAGMVGGGIRSAPEDWNIVLHVDMRGDLDREALAEAVTAVTVRHESLRTGFVHRDGEWMQQVLPAAPASLPEVDLTGLPAEESAAGIDAESRRLAQTGFDVGAGHLVRFRLLRASADRWRLVVVAHHAVCDGWGMSVLLADLASAYRQAVTGGPVSLPRAAQSIEYARWQRENWSDRIFDRRMEHWRERLRGTDLTAGFPPTVARSEDTPGVFLRREIPTELVARVADFTAARGYTPFAAWATALGVLVARRTGVTSMAFGTPYAAREDARHDSLITSVAMVMPLGVHVPSGTGFGDACARTMADHATAVDHLMPFRKLCEGLVTDRAGLSKMFPVLLAYQSSVRLDLDLPGLETTVDEPHNGRPHRRTAFFVEPGRSRWRFGVLCDGARYDETTAGEWLDAWIEALAEGIGDPDTPLRLT
ncbi:amino acid adenylation domain-containing protein/natural product biosynthesis luciferase-like monooxygenase protein [Stackebrandtia albiflava]|uniref:Amino acid adenylation domain-containing protein/natural product biosynthesis luciferase-like monooxygenase protein n=1 Tax=Stackebrandtia albiflava TaxID=406432 RepID=A0A562VE29_9ACTN|nr:non-ribosomal peptide synthetase [Stackebrandtia albiflava]TWJ16125.1 amino acid adenylation domain-containing protein/natural product biosynthesis luciferase-like monooxygenase protein [Stackebrandtia albiflava]